MNYKSTVKGETYILRTYMEKVLSNATDVLENNTINSFEDFTKRPVNF